MKPSRTFLFLLLLLLVLISFHIGSLLSGGKGLFLQEQQGKKRERFISSQPGQTEEMNRQMFIDDRTSQWKEDQQMSVINQVYRLEPDIFLNPQLKNIPLQPFEFDTSGLSSILLEDFFSRLLAIRNPHYASDILQWYENAGFWDDDISGERPNFIRILHYGDSQIENDQISSTLRRLFQDNFGGRGKGLLPLFQPAVYRKDIRLTGEWHIIRYENSSTRRNYGVSTAHLASPPIMNITGNPDEKKGHLTFSLPSQLTPKGKWENQISENHPDSGISTKPIFLEAIVHSDISDYDLTISYGNQRLTPVEITETEGQKKLTYAITFPSGNDQRIHTDMIFGKNHDIFALSINDTNGICLDNLSISGSSGSVFSPNHRRFLSNQLQLLNTRLILYQFGSDAIQKQEKDDNFHERYRLRMLQELSYLRIQMPQVPVIVIGISDQAALPGSNVHNPDMDTIRKIQKEVAFQCGCAFWDLYLAMGGPNSMQRWASNTPALASSDMIHFTHEGGELVGKLFYQAFLDAFQRFLLKERKAMLMERALWLEKANLTSN